MEKMTNGIDTHSSYFHYINNLDESGKIKVYYADSIQQRPWIFRCQH